MVKQVPEYAGLDLTDGTHEVRVMFETTAEMEFFMDWLDAFYPDAEADMARHARAKELVAMAREIDAPVVGKRQ